MLLFYAYILLYIALRLEPFFFFLRDGKSCENKKGQYQEGGC